MIILNNNAVKLCCNGQNCPVVENLHNGTYKITDDFGGTVILTQAEFDMITDVKEHFKNGVGSLKVAENNVIRPGDVLING